MRRIGFVGGVVLVLAALGAGIASAFVTFDKASAPADTDLNVVMNAPVEVLVGYTEKIVVAVPDGFRALSCGAINGYTCAQSSAANPKRTLITWQRSTPGQELVTPTRDFPFRIHTTSTPGKYEFDVDQFYSNGEEVHWNGAEGSEYPAPTLTITGAGTPAVTNTTVPSNNSTDTTSPSSSPSFDFDTISTVPFEDTTATTVATDTTPTTTTTDDSSLPNLVASSSGDDDDDKGIRGAERIILLGLALLAVGSASFATLRQRNL